MGWFVLMGILTVLGTLGFFGALLYGNKGVGILAAAGAATLGVIVTLFAMFATVENGHIGIVKQFGSIVGTTGEGLVTKAPWQSLDEVSVRNEIREYVMDDRREEGSGSAVSKDSQPVFLDVVVNYSLVRAGAVELYRETGGHYVERILDPAAFQITKEVTAQYKAIDFAANREKIRLEIQEKLDAEVSQVTTQDGERLEAININNVSLKNVDFTDALSKAIEETVQREQEAKREQAAVQIKEAQARQAAAQAKGEADAARERAKGQADSTYLVAQADAARIRLEGRALRENPSVLRLRAIEKLNPNVKLVVPEDSTLVQGLDSALVEGGE
jgi:regulator of protease activity HflC (stomatin/prohibitin superfamily)